MVSQLYQAVKARLQGTEPDDWRKLASSTGLEFAWIRLVKLGEIREPGCSKLECLHLALTGKRFPAEA